MVGAVVEEIVKKAIDEKVTSLSMLATIQSMCFPPNTNQL